MIKYKKIVVASNNQGKIKEFESSFASIGVTVVPQKDLGIQEVEEPHMTFVENALVKARYAAAFTELPVLADDSGICVDSLSGQPGVRSARYASKSATDLENNLFLMERLRGRRIRNAAYYCVIVLIVNREDPTPLLATGEWRGKILESPRGSYGFGYDPLFYDPEIGKTAAELSRDQKNKVSHRGIAIRKIIKLITNIAI